MLSKLTTTFIAITLSAWCAVPSWALEGEMEHFVEFHASGSNNHTPLWLNANKYGLSSINSKYVYARGIISYSNDIDRWGIKYKFCGDLVLPYNIKQEGYKGSEYKSSIILEQLYGEVRWKHLVLTGGAKQFPSELRDNQLSSGAQTLGINARPIPQGRIALDDWWTIPFTRQWISFKGHFAFGIMTDANWEETFVGSSGNKYNRWTRYHEKAGYLRIGKVGERPFSVIVGLEMGAQFGGTLYNYYGNDQTGYRGNSTTKLISNPKSYFNAFIPGGGDTDETKFKNAEGNQVGSWLMRLNWEGENYSIGLYGDHYFEDHSSMFQLDYNGYGEGENWDTKQDFKFFLYDFKDGQLGLDVHLKKFRYLHGLVVEYMNTTYQSGPIYHDRNQGNSDHLGGCDDYYNHSTLPGWQHWGQAIGNPLYRSPLYNTDGYINFEYNRFRALHGGINGSIIDGLDYRILGTRQVSFGTYHSPLTHKAYNTSFLIELSYQMPPNTFFEKFKWIVGYGEDHGKIYGNNKGLQVTLQFRP